ncbi:MAG: hypothetical protein QXJ27_01230, partial [Thermoplasmata archaeon]
TADGALRNKIRINLAISEFNSGDVERAAELLQQVLEETEERGELINHGFAAVNLAYIMLEKKEPREAEKLAAKALEIGEKLNLELLKAPALVNLGMAEIALGNEEGRRKVAMGEERYALLRAK